jgi:predicted N-acetyltransferase YhbS
MIDIQVEMPGDGSAIEQLLDLSFGPDREHLPSYRLRQGIAADGALGLTASDGNRLVGTLRFWPVLVAGRTPALLLGPLAVDPGYRRQGIARNLVKHGLGRARARGHGMVFAVGDQWMFGRFGFTPATPLGLAMTGQADDSRFLVLALKGGALAGMEGVLCPVQASPPGQVPDKIAEADLTVAT